MGSLLVVCGWPGSRFVFHAHLPKVAKHKITGAVVDLLQFFEVLCRAVFIDDEHIAVVHKDGFIKRIRSGVYHSGVGADTEVAEGVLIVKVLVNFMDAFAMLRVSEMVNKVFAALHVSRKREFQKVVAVVGKEIDVSLCVTTTNNQSSVATVNDVPVQVKLHKGGDADVVLLCDEVFEVMGVHTGFLDMTAGGVIGGPKYTPNDSREVVWVTGARKPITSGDL